MLILALDTTTRKGSCALVRDGSVIREAGSDPEQPPAARLPRDLMQLLDAAHVTLDAIDAFAVATGPGSFTGLRIGIATMQGLAFAQRKPLFGVSGFDALAASVASGNGWIAPWVDAWRGEVYAALYFGTEERVAPVVASPHEVLEGLARSGGDQMLFVGDGAEAFSAEIRAAIGDRAAFAEPISPLSAGAVGRLAAERAGAGTRPQPHAILPLYVRRSDAELARNRRVTFTIDPLSGSADLDGVLDVEAETFTNPWTREMYSWELQNRNVCHIYVVRTGECPVAGFCAFWLVFDEIHINNVAIRPALRGRGLGTALLRHVMAEARGLGAKRATLEVRASNGEARRLYERLGFYVAGTRRNYYTQPVEDALILWHDELQA